MKYAAIRFAGAISTAQRDRSSTRPVCETRTRRANAGVRTTSTKRGALWLEPRTLNLKALRPVKPWWELLSGCNAPRTAWNGLELGAASPKPKHRQRTQPVTRTVGQHGLRQGICTEALIHRMARNSSCKLRTRGSGDRRPNVFTWR